jgi:hypothetical protein
VGVLLIWSVKKMNVTNRQSGGRAGGGASSPTAADVARPRGAFMALDTGRAVVDDPMDRRSSSPLTASLRWGLGWTVLVALGTCTACVSATPIDDPLDTDHSYSDCVSALGDMPDAIDHHINACQAVESAGAAMR